MKQYVYPRVIGISTLKNVAYTVIVIAGLLFVYGNVPMKVFALASQTVFFLNTFVFAGWTFAEPAKVSIRQFITIMLVTYVWDIFVSMLVFGFLLDENLFLSQRLTRHLLFFSLHAVAMAAALYERKRSTVKRGMAEGLEG